MKESEIQKQILDGLAAEHIFAFRLNTSAFSGEHKGKRWFTKSHSLGPGAADIVAILDATEDETCKQSAMACWCRRQKVVWIEVKAASGKQSSVQKSFQSHVESLGHLYVIARSFDDVRALWLERCAGERVGGTK